jgi:hypothetical protein
MQKDLNSESIPWVASWGIAMGERLAVQEMWVAVDLLLIFQASNSSTVIHGQNLPSISAFPSSSLYLHTSNA